MDNSEVLDAQEVNAPDQNTQQVEQQDVGATVINSMYNQAQRPTKVTGIVGEPDHASEIAKNAMNRQQADATNNYTSMKQKDYDQSVTTTTVQSGNGVISATWEPSYELTDEYFVNDEEKSTWNKMAEQMADLEYAQQVAQNRYESMQSRLELNQAAKKAWDEYFGAEIAAAQTREKMGWTGGQKQASDLDVKFLQAQTASDMYTQEEAQRYGVDTKLGIARLYADAKQNELALKYYQDERDMSFKEAEQTGWYIPVEAREMMIQSNLADEILADPNSTEEEKARARRVKEAAQTYYDAKGFTHGYAYDDQGNIVTHYYGIETLNRLNYLEDVRHNKEDERLQGVANDIAEKQLAVSRSQLRNAEYELSLKVATQNMIEEGNIRDGVASGATTITYATGGNYVWWTQDDSGAPIQTTKPIPVGTKLYTNGGKTYAEIYINGENRLVATSGNVQGQTGVKTDVYEGVMNPDAKNGTLSTADEAGNRYQPDNVGGIKITPTKRNTIYKYNHQITVGDIFGKEKTGVKGNNIADHKIYEYSDNNGKAHFVYWDGGANKYIECNQEYATWMDENKRIF